MDRFRYVMALLLVTMLPPALLFWLLIHPLARFWRRRGAVVTYSVVAPICFALAAVIYRFRGPLLEIDYGFSPTLAAAGLLLYAVAAVIEVLRSRHLKLGILAGLPEVSKQRGPGRLLDQGIYARIRHPRYVALVVGLAGWALVINYLAFYVTLAASIPALLLVVRLEERELADRFGDAYRAYRRRVPAFLPRRGGHHS